MSDASRGRERDDDNDDDDGPDREGAVGDDDDRDVNDETGSTAALADAGPAAEPAPREPRPPLVVRPWYLIVLLLVALAIRAGWGLSRPADDASLQLLPDQREYLELARSLLRGEGLAFVDPRFGETGQLVRAFRMPGYPAFLAMCGGDVRVARGAQALLDTGTVLAAYLLARRWLARGPSLVAAALVAFNPFLVYFSGLILSETLFAAMLAWGMVLLVVRRGAWWVLGVVVLALSVHVRPSAAGLAVVLAVGAAFVNKPGGAAYQAGARDGAEPDPAERRPSRWLRWPLPVGTTALVLTLLALLPWAARNRQVLGTWLWTTTNGGFTAYDGFNPDATGASDQRFVTLMPQLRDMGEVARSQYLTKLAQQYVREHPQRAAELSVQKVARTWSPVPLSDEFGGKPLYVAAALAFSLPFDLLVIAGLWRGWRGGGLPGAAKVFLLLPALYLTAVHALSVGSLRYRVPAEVPMAVLAAAGAGIFALPAADRWRRADVP